MAGVVVPIDGDISPILAQFGKLPGRTQEEMDAVGRVIEQEITRGRIAKGFADLPGVSQKAAKKAANMLAREIDKGAREAEKSLQDVNKGLKVLGSSHLDDLMDLSDALGALGPAGFAVGTGLAAAATAAGALVAGGALVTFLYDAAAATGALDDETRALETALGDVQKGIGGKVAPVFEEFAIVAIASTLALGDFVDKVWEYIEVAGQWYNSGSLLAAGLDAASGGMLKAAGTMVRLQDATDEGARAQGGYIDEARALLGPLAEVDSKTGDVATSTSNHAAAVRSVTAAMREQAPVIDEQMAKWEQLDAAEASALAEVDKQIAQTMGQMPAALEQSSEATRDMRDTYLSSAQDIGGAIGDLSGLLLDQGNISKDAATALVVVQKAAGIAQIGISTAIAVMNALANYPGPAGPIAAAAYIATGVAQAAVVAATPTTFHTGGMVRAPDEVGITARNGEGVLTAQGVDAIGGQAGLNRANRGEGGGGSITVVQQYQHRVFDAFVADNVRSDGPLRKAIRGKRRIGHAGRR